MSECLIYIDGAEKVISGIGSCFLINFVYKEMRRHTRQCLCRQSLCYVFFILAYAFVLTLFLSDLVLNNLPDWVTI